MGSSDLGENKGINEEMRFVAMKLRNSGKPKKIKKGRGNAESIKEVETGNSGEDQKDVSISEEKVEKDDDGSNANEDIWQPCLEGFLKYLVDSKLVFSTIERIVDESSDVSCKLSLFSFGCCSASSILIFEVFFFPFQRLSSFDVH